MQGVETERLRLRDVAKGMEIIFSGLITPLHPLQLYPFFVVTKRTIFKNFFYEFSLKVYSIRNQYNYKIKLPYEKSGSYVKNKSSSGKRFKSSEKR